jgi:hypothetical protein
MRGNISGNNNIGIGFCALRTNSGCGNNNVAFGHSSMYGITSGSNNFAVGCCSFRNSGVGNNNIAVGYASMYGCYLGILGCYTVGNNNIALGNSALFCITSGSNNIAQGYKALYCSTSGATNIAIGLCAGSSITVGSNNTVIGSLSAGSSCVCTVLIGAGTCERIRVDNSGLYVNNTLVGGGVTISDDTTTNATRYVIWEDVTSGSVSTVGISSTKLYFNPSTGTLNATIFNSLSDETQKKNVVQIQNATEIISKINGVEFDWIDNDKKSSGVIAQQLETIIPYLIYESELGLKSVNYSGLIAYLIESNKELNERIKKLENLR